MRPILTRTFEAVPAVAMTSETFSVPPLAVNHFFVVNASVTGTLFTEWFDPANDAWVRVGSDATVAAGADNDATLVTHSAGGVLVRARWLPDSAAGSPDSVSIFVGTSGAH